MIIRRNILAIFIALLVTAITFLSVVCSKHFNGYASNQIKQKDLSQYPIVDSEAPEDTDPVKRAKRRAKGKKYNKGYKAVGPTLVTTIDDFHWPREFPAIPVAQSDAVVVGTVTGSQVFLSEDKMGVYSEFTIKIEETLKTVNTPLVLGTSIIAEREGGQVKFPGGHISRLLVAGLDMPRVGEKYLFFLKSSNEDFSIITAYEIKGARILPLDYSPIFDLYKDAEVMTLISAVRTALSDNSPKAP